MNEAAVNAPTSRGGQTKAEIERVALELFTVKGYDAVSMREISEHLGITKAALYYHFEGKIDIVRSLLTDYETSLGELITWARGQAPTPEFRRELLDRWVELVRERGMAVIRFISANQHVLQEAKQDSVLRQYFKTIFGLLAKPNAPLRDQLRARMAGMSIHVAVMASQDLDTDIDEVLDAAKEIALELLSADSTGKRG